MSGSEGGDVTQVTLTGDEPQADGFEFPSPVHEAVYTLLRDHVGPEQAIPSGEISTEVGIDDSTAWPSTRRIIREVVDVGVPIAANGDGYYIIDSTADLRRYMQSLDERAQQILERRSAVLNAALEHGTPPEPIENADDDAAEQEQEEP